jgi:hypothetical protein
MSNTTLRKRQPLAPPVPPPLNFEVYDKALFNQPATPPAPHIQTDEQLKHVGWQVIEATNRQRESVSNRLKELALSVSQPVKRLYAAAKIPFSKLTPFQIMGGAMVIAAMLALVVIKSQLWLILAASGAAQLVIDSVLKKKIQ